MAPEDAASGPGEAVDPRKKTRFARAYLAKKLPGREAIAGRLKELFYVESAGTPVHRGKRLFYPKREAGKEKFAVYWREGTDGTDHVLLDPNEWSTDGSASLGVWSVSWDGQTDRLRGEGGEQLR